MMRNMITKLLKKRCLNQNHTEKVAKYGCWKASIAHDHKTQ